MRRIINQLVITGPLAILVLLSTSCMLRLDSSSQPKETSLLEMECYTTFEKFAYFPPEVADPGLPTEPWQLESTLSDEFVEDYHISSSHLQVMFARSVEGNQEVWLANPVAFLNEDAQNVLIYRPESGEWQVISGVVDNTDAFIKGVFQTSDGVIWGINGWEQRTSDPKGPILSKFNEHTRQFEFAPGMLEFPLTDEYRYIRREIVTDSQNNIWILISNDGIYQYDPIAESTKKRVDLPDIEISTATGLADGTIYFTDNTYLQRTTGESNFRLFDGMLYQFVPETGDLLELGTPDKPWPLFVDIFEASDGKVWFSAVGYRNVEDGIWHLVHPDPDFAFKRAWHQGSDSPKITLESSDGLLWFNKYEDILGGTAWYDPETGKGCMFTGIPANIIEDDQQQLWMLADGKLYRYSLEE